MTSEGEPPQEGGGCCNNPQCGSGAPGQAPGIPAGANPAQIRSIINNIDIEALKKMKIMQAMEAQKKADQLPSLTPEVKWAQNPEAISLTISITQVMRPGKSAWVDLLIFRN